MHSWEEGVLEALREVLSRLAFRANPDQLRETFPLVLKYHARPPIGAHIRLHEASTAWFRRLFETADRELLLEWLVVLIRAPLFDQAGVSVLTAREASPDPMRHFPADRLKSGPAVAEETLQRIAVATNWLLKRASSETGEARQRALYRLADVYKAKLMTAEQQRQLGELLWSHTTAAGLPDLQNFAVFGFLHLPAPRDVNVAEAVKSYIVSLPAEGFVKYKNGTPSVSVSQLAQPLIYEVSLASKPIVQLRGESLGTVEWTAEEADKLYKKARDWWSNDKVAFKIAGDGAPFGGIVAEPVRNTLHLLGRYLSRAVIPHVNWPNEEQWNELQEWLHEIRGFNVFDTVALPYIVSRRPEKAALVASTIRDDLDSKNEDACAAAAKALAHWIHLSRMDVAPAAPSDLLMKLVERVAFRVNPGIVSCLGELTYLIIDADDAITLEHASLIVGALMPWYYATVLPVQDGARSEFCEDERPELRTFVGRLAGALSLWWRKHVPKAEQPKPVLFWREACASDSLPEIRRAFTTWDRWPS
jgi:hypothetical protein